MAASIRNNKFVYTKAQSRVIGQEQLCPKIMKKMKFWTFLKILDKKAEKSEVILDRLTDRPTDRQT